MAEKQDEKKPTLGDKINAANKPLSDKELAAARREDRVRALEEEKAGLKGNPRLDEDTVARRSKEIDAQIKHFKDEQPSGRRSGNQQQAAQSGGQQTAAQS